MTIREINEHPDLDMLDKLSLIVTDDENRYIDLIGNSAIVRDIDGTELCRFSVEPI